MTCSRYSKIGQEELRLEPVSLQDAVRDALALLEADVHAKEASVTVEDSLPEVIGHSATLVLLINNLVSNALKFVSPGVVPRIHIRAEEVQSAEDGGRRSEVGGRSQPPSLDSAPALGAPPDSALRTPSTLRSRATAEDGHSALGRVRLWVEDNGIGIEPRDLGKVFHVFQRLHGRSLYPGTGLGLAIVRKGAERMGGSVGVKSQPGAGSRFWVDLPQAGQCSVRQTGGQLSQATVEKQPNTGGARVERRGPRGEGRGG